MKPRVMSLVIFTCAVGLLTAPSLVSTKEAVIGILLVSLGAGAAGALNMWYESDLDALMTRTCLRPIPTGKVNKNQALIFGITLSIVSVVALDYFTNRISAAILLLTILFYVFVYTIWLKRRTPQNIVIGGAAGAFPPVIGWTISTGSLSLEGNQRERSKYLVSCPPHIFYCFRKSDLICHRGFRVITVSISEENPEMIIKCN